MTDKKQGLRLRYSALSALLFLILSSETVFGQMGMELPPPPKTVNLFEEELFGLEKYSVDSTFFALKPGAYKRSVTLDSTGQYISIKESIDDVEFYFPAVLDLDTYVERRLAFNERELFKRKFSDAILNQKEAEFGAIELDIPFRIKSETFTRIFGSDRISLRVTGNISFDLSGRTEERSGSATSARENQNTFSPRFNQTQQFTVEGKIGEKVTVSVQQNSEAVTDIENTLKLRYDGDEDEIVEKIEAGNVSLSLPSTKYVIFGGSNKGLFGLKADLRMGNLFMTTIASLERGEQQELKISGSSSSATSTVKDINFIQNRYFFVDSTYRNNFEKGFTSDLQQFIYTEGTDITQLEVWLSVNSTDDQAKQGIAAIDPQPYEGYDFNDLVLTDSDNGKVDKGTFIRLSQEQYNFDPYRGFFWLNQNVDNNTLLAVSYATSNGLKYGTLLEDDTTSTVILKMIKPKQMVPPTDNPAFKDTWKLMMRNVYSLGGSNIESEGFEMQIQTINEQSQNQGEKTFLTLLGLDIVDENGGPGSDEKVDQNPYIIDRAKGILIFPTLQPFDPLEGSIFPGLIDQNRVKMYNLSQTNTSALQSASKFEMIITSKSTKSTFDLGFYVLEGSEVVTLNGRNLEREKDYIIDYFSGQLTLISNEAKRSSADLSIKYERANLFQLDKKTILGGRLEYRFLDDSFIGMTGLYLNKSTVDRRVRVGQEPFQNFVWDVNAAFKFKPRFLTDMMDALPLVETSDESRFEIEGEFAQVLPNPNTLNNTSTGDDNGVAYIDDFEASKRTTTLGIRYRTWSPASAPVKLGEAGFVNNPVMAEKSRARFTWFNPYNQTPIKEIWPERDVNAQTGQTTDVLGLEFWREEGADPDSAWGGIMRSTASFPDQQKTKYIELWVKGYTGRINIDVGTISEDYYVRGQNYRGQPSLGNLNTEDRNTNGLLEDNEDTGIDGIPNGQPGDDPFDDWNEPNRGVLDRPDGVDYTGVNGTEGNGNARGARYPDTEDLDGDGQLNVFNNYYTYSFSLDSNDVEARQWITGSTSKDGRVLWRQFRIPLSQPSDSVGNPDRTFQQVLNTRLWVDDIQNTEPKRIYLATFDFVGNEWEEEGYRTPTLADTLTGSDLTDFVKDDSVFTLTTYNTEENAVDLGPTAPDPYDSPPGVSGVRDRITNAVSKEQSLVMRFENLPAGAIAEARKTLYSKLDLVNYSRMKMFLYGSRRSDPIIPENPDVDSSKIQFYIRFGADDNNYYEYGQDIYQGWNKRNRMDIDLDGLASLTAAKNKATRKIFLAGSPGGYYLSRGNASLKTIRYFTIGIKNKNSQSFTGEIWLDELRLSDVRKNSATALRVKTNLKLADVARFTAEWESQDADFHNISTQFGDGSTTERQNYSGNIYLDKFLPASWDLSLPVDARASFSRSIPKYLPNTDDLTGYQNDTFTKKVESLFGLRKLPDEIEEQSTISETYGIGTTIKKRGKSQHWLPKYTIDEMSLDFDYAKQNRSSWDIKYNRSISYKERYSYRIPFSNKNYVEPFSFTRSIPVLKEIYDTKVYYSPTNITMNLSVSDTETENLRRDSTAQISRTQNTGTTRSLSTSYKLFQNMTFNFSRTHITDADFDSTSRLQLYKNIFSKLDFGRETDVTQKFGADYKPSLFSWLQPDFSFDSNFRYQLVQGYKYKQAVNRTSKRIGATFNPNKLVNLIYTPEKDTKSSGRRGRPRPKPKTGDDKKEGEDEEDADESKGISIPNPLIMIYNVFDSWSSIKFNYSIDNSITNQYLTDIPKWDYQLGFTNNPGVPQDQSLLEEGIVLQAPSIQKSNNLRTSTSINIGKQIRANFNHDYRTSEAISQNGQSKQGGTSISFLALGDDPLKDFKGVSSDIRRFVPDWNVQVSGLEEYLFFKDFAQSITLDHGHNGKYDEKNKLSTDRTRFEPYQQTFTNSWSPLLGFNIRTVWGVSTTIRANNSTNYSYQTSGGATRTENNSFTITMNYSKSTGFRIPIPIWPFKGRTFKNEINFTLTYDQSENRSFTRQAGSSKFEERQKNSSWKLRPSATYRFNSRVQGSMFFETGATQNKISGKYSYSEFGINVNIAIRD
ncbi:MAG: cell surface protein SprA [Calditrichae bacterium]|nr:cell surface protein SprA [Calditrichota bacterium]MCB9058780.1 cell surface protein SprA [Calditrichia bacterium]